MNSTEKILCIHCGIDCGHSITYKSSPNNPLEGPICYKCFYTPSIEHRIEAIEQELEELKKAIRRASLGFL